MSGALAAITTVLKRGNGATPEVFTTIANVGDIDGPDLKSDLEDATNHSSPNGYLEFVPTTKSLGELKFPCQFIPSNATHSYTSGIVYDWNSGTLHNYQMVFPDSTIWQFSVYVTNIHMKAPVKGLLTADVTMTLTGATLA